MEGCPSGEQWASVTTVAVDDADLASWFATGDADSVRVVYQTYGRLVFSIAFKVLGDRGLAEDATQQTFVQAWRGAGSYDPSRALGAWLTTIAKRVAIDVYRRERRHRNLVNLDNLDTAHSPSLITLPPSIDQIHDVAQVRRALDELPTTDRDLIRMQHFDEARPRRDRQQARDPDRHREVANLPGPPAAGRPAGPPAHRTGRLVTPRPSSKGVPMADSDLTPAERAELERVRDVLADPAVWTEPRA